MTEVQLEVQEGDTEWGIKHKLPDTWVVNWEEQNLLIMEFTRPNDRGELFFHKTDTLKLPGTLP